MKIISDPTAPEGTPRAVIVDCKDAIVADLVHVVTVVPANGVVHLAVELAGATLDGARVDHLYLLDAEGAATLCAHLVNTAASAGGDMSVRFQASLDALLDEAWGRG